MFCFTIIFVVFQIYCGKLPKDLFEDALIPVFENIGAIWDLRLMMDPISGRNRGYCFVTFTEKKAAEEAVRQVVHYVWLHCWSHSTAVERQSVFTCRTLDLQLMGDHLCG